MKTKLFAIAAMLVIVAGLSNSDYAAAKNKVAAVELTNISNISKIEIRGNVEVYVSYGQNDKVKVYNDYYAESALVQNQNGVLRITSYKAQKLVVWVTASNLQAISAYDNARVRSFGKFSAIELEVNLHNSASAQLNLDAYAAKINVNDHSKINLAGTAGIYSLVHTHDAFVNNNNFKAAEYTDTLASPVVKQQTGNELAVL